MKKIIILIVLVLCLVGCNDKKVSFKKPDKIVNKIDQTKPYLESKKYKEYVLSNGDLYFAEWTEVNLDNEEMSNLNLTLKNNILLSTKSFEVLDNKVTKGSIVNYRSYISRNFLSIVEETKSYFNGIYGSTITKVYNIDIKTGVIVDNTKLLRYFEEEEEDIYEEIRESRIPDADYVAMYVRNNGYNLYVDAQGRLVLLLEYVNDDETIKKELVLED
jgi:hypothetical protein